MRRHRRLMLSAALFALPAFTTVEAVLGEPFALGVGETAQVETSGISLTFVRVDSDSRCPRDVVCIWAGEAKLFLHARFEGGDEKDIVLVIPGEGASAALGRYRLEVLALEPDPESGRKIAAEEYVATFRVDEEEAEGGV